MENKKRIEELVLKLICGNESTFYGRFITYIQIFPTNKVQTAAASMMSTGPIIVYNEEFLSSLSDSELYFLFMHEMFHILQSHLERGAGYDPQLHNVAADAIINEYLIANTQAEFIKGGIRLNPKYKGDMVSEFYYFWLKENDPNAGKPADGDGDGSGAGSKPGTVRTKSGTRFDDHDFSADDLSDAEKAEQGLDHAIEVKDAQMARAMVDNIIKDIKDRGCNTNNIEQMIDKLRKTKKNYIKDIIGGLNFIVGKTKYKTYKRMNRRQISGMKGISKYSNEICVLLDTSGSMSGEFEKALSTLFNRDITCYIVMCDTEVKNVIRVQTKQELSKIKLTGGGGTEITPGIQYVLAHKELSRLNTLILTDGYCDDLDTSKLKKCLVLTTGVAPRTSPNTKTIVIKE